MGLYLGSEKKKIQLKNTAYRMRLYTPPIIKYLYSCNRELLLDANNLFLITKEEN
jgi:hypothetical protein